MVSKKVVLLSPKTMNKSKNEKAEKLRAISKRFLILKEQLNLSNAERFGIAGQYIAEAFEIGAFNRPVHLALKVDVKYRLSQKNVDGYISGWDEFRLWLKYKNPPFPHTEDIAESFPADCELVAKVISKEAKSIEQADLASTKQNGKTTKKWYRNRTIQAALISAFVLILLTVTGWFLNSHSNKQGISLRKDISTSFKAETKGDLSPAVVTYGPNSPVSIYQMPGQSDVNSANKETDGNRPL